MNTKSTVLPDFDGRVVASFESRRSDLMGEAIVRHHGVPLLAPSMQEIPLKKNPEALAFGERLLAGEVSMVIFLTGVGTRFLAEVLCGQFGDPALEALRHVTVVARGPKSVQALRELEVPVTLSIPEPNTWREIIETLDTAPQGIDLKDKTVAIQEYGESSADLIKGLKKRGARVIQVPVYRWALPDDTRPLEESIHAIIAGRVEMALFTSAMQVRHLLRHAAALGLEKALRAAMTRVVVSSIGPTCSQAIQECGFAVDFEPSHPKMGHLIAESARRSQELVQQKRVPFSSFILQKRSLDSVSEAALRREKSPFMRALARKPVPFTPVWLMRQAGRYMKEYRRLRDRTGFLSLCKTPELCAQAAVEAQEILNVDAAILFSDILLITEAFGFGLAYESGEGPVIDADTRSARWIEEIPEVEPEEALGYVMDAVRLTRSSLSPKIPLIGFSGAPFTLAAYILEGGGSRYFLKTKKFMISEESSWHALMEKITRALVKYLNAQASAGADCLQIFDSWVGCLGPEDYRRYVLPHSRALIRGLRSGVPVIHFGTGTGAFLEQLCEAGGDAIGVDFRIELDEAWKRIGYDRAIQGNFDPAFLIAPPRVIEERTARVLQQAGGRAGHIFNLGHGILPVTPVEHVQALVEFVHRSSATGGGS